MFGPRFLQNDFVILTFSSQIGLQTLGARLTIIIIRLTIAIYERFQMLFFQIIIIQTKSKVLGKIIQRRNFR